MAAVVLALAQAPRDSISLRDALARARATRGQVTLTAAQVAEACAALRSAGAITNPIVSFSHSDAVPRQHLLVDQPLDHLLRRGPERSAARARIAGAVVGGLTVSTGVTLLLLPVLLDALGALRPDSDRAGNAAGVAV